VQETDILRQLEQRLAKFKVPKRVIFLEELPRNTMGKVQKAALREKLAK
jgi:malonyl-CoA/methylmalonyl-CoA synthetase